MPELLGEVPHRQFTCTLLQPEVRRRVPLQNETREGASGMITSVLRSLRYLIEDMVSVAKWAVAEIASEVDYRLQPSHVRQGWAAELADIEAGIDVHEPYAPYLQWGGPETWPQNPYCNRCGYPHPTTQTCLRDQSSPVVPPTATGDRPAGVVADPPSAPPAGHPYYEVFVPEEDRVPTSELLRWGAVCADVLADMTAEQHRGGRNPYRLDAAAMRNRADAFQAIENTT